MSFMDAMENVMGDKAPTFDKKKKKGFPAPKGKPMPKGKGKPATKGKPMPKGKGKPATKGKPMPKGKGKPATKGKGKKPFPPKKCK